MNPKVRLSQPDPLQTFGFLQSSPALEPTALGLDISEAAVRGHRLPARSGRLDPSGIGWAGSQTSAGGARLTVAALQWRLK